MQLQVQPSPRARFSAAQIAGMVFLDAMNSGITLDANDVTAIFARELEYIDQELIRTQTTPLKAEQLVPYMAEGGPGVDAVTYRMVTEVGRAEWIGNRADDLPRVDVVGKEFTRKVESLGASWAVTVQDLIRVAQSPTIRLDSERKRAAFEAVRRLHDRTAMLGHADFGWYGLINCPNVPLVTPITGNWASATPLQIVADTNKLTWSVVKATKEVWEIDTMLLPLVLSEVMEKPFGVDADFTVRKYIEKNSAHVKKIEYTNHLDLADEQGDGPRVMVYKKDPAVVRYGANAMFTEEPPQRKGLNIETPCHGRSSGTQFRQPNAAAYMDGC